MLKKKLFLMLLLSNLIFFTLFYFPLLEMKKPLNIDNFIYLLLFNSQKSFRNILNKIPKNKKTRNN